jgi:selenocysteine-specific elongation factor
LQTNLAVPRASQLGLEADLLHALIRDERLVRVGDDLVFLPEQISAVASALDRFEDEFTVAEFRDLLEITRRQAVPLLEWFDKQGITLRRGDTRVVRR